MEVVANLCEAHAEPDGALPDGKTPLFLASWAGHSQVARQLCMAGADASRAAEDGRTPLCAAAQQGHAEIVGLLLGTGVFGAGADGGISPLVLAAEQGHVEVIRLLCMAGASGDAGNLAAGDGSDTPLYVAAWAGHMAAVRCLCQASADCRQPAKTGVTPLLAACKQGHLDVVKFLYGRTASEDGADDWIPASWVAANYGHWEIASYLCEAAQFKCKAPQGTE